MGGQVRIPLPTKQTSVKLREIVRAIKSIFAFVGRNTFKLRKLLYFKDIFRAVTMGILRSWKQTVKGSIALVQSPGQNR